LLSTLSGAASFPQLVTEGNLKVNAKGMAVKRDFLKCERIYGREDFDIEPQMSCL
jgi:hypothetical protein